MGRRAAWAAATVLLAGCLFGPNYQRPDIPQPAAWREDSATAAIPDDSAGRAQRDSLARAMADSLANISWFAVLQDTVLQQLEEIAVRENKDVLTALASVQEFRAQLGLSKADLYPTIDLGADAATGHYPATKQLPDFDYNRLSLTGSLSWELDFWGRIRRSTEAAKAELLSAEENHRAVLLTLLADVATVYFDLRQADDQLAISRRTLASRLESLQLERARLREGLISELDVAQFEAEAADAASKVAQFERLVAIEENLLSVLLGRNPGYVPRGLSLTEQPEPLAIPAGLPSTLLERRPDILASEHFLHAETARIGAVIAERFPRISLTGILGWQSVVFENLIQSPNLISEIAGGAVLPATDQFLRIPKKEASARARALQAQYQYEKAILVAFQEVDNSITSVRTSADQLVADQARVNALATAAHLARRRYDAGISSYLEVLDAERSLFAAELTLAETQRLRLVSTVQLFKALGGGWPMATSDSVSTN
jgi:multidrug efflux system outer membrane protein